MDNKFHNIKTYQIITFLSLIIIAFIILYIPIHRANLIKDALYKARYNQIQYLNTNSSIIPKSINMIKGHIIHNETALKDIVYINLLTKTKSNNVKDIYYNQIKIFTITKRLLDNANKNSLLSNNENFKKLKSEFDDIYTNAQKQFELCKTRTKHFKKYIDLPIYKNVIDRSNINDIICTD